MKLLIPQRALRPSLFVRKGVFGQPCYVAAMCRARASAAIILLAVPCAALATQVSRLDPSLFATAPVAVRSGLKQHGCTVPQTYLAGGRQNVVRGSFTKPTVKEWAALCSVDGSSEILVFSATSSQPLARFARASDETFVQSIAPGRTGYSRRLCTVPSSVRGLSGVEDAFLEKASTVWVHERGQWHGMPGAD